MNLRYPWFPSEQSLSMAILSNSSVADPSGELYPLSRFVLEYPRLKGGMELLPGIVELYQYLHTELTYAITYKEVTTITLRRLARVISKHFVVNGDRKAHYEKLKSKSVLGILRIFINPCSNQLHRLTCSCSIFIK